MHIAVSLAVNFVVISTSSTFSDAFLPSVTPPYASTAAAAPCCGKRLQLNLFFPSRGDDQGDFNNDDDSDDESGDLFDLEKARERLEALLGEPESTNKMRTVERPTVRSPTYTPSPLPALDVILPPAPPLTTIERERREAEIQLLARLAEGDESVSDLWTLWFGERGSEAAQKLLKAEELTGDGPQSWVQAEIILRELIQEYGVYWVEPVNRLATLFYMQGRLDEAETLSKIVLAVKPWHFGALSGIVMIYAAQADSDKARLWAASRLPTFAPSGANRRRTAWAETAVQSAKESLENAEKRIQELFGAPDEYTLQSPRNNIQDDYWGDSDGDAWQ